MKRRSRAVRKIRQIQQCLQRLATSLPFELEVVDVREQPYLVEYFRLVATPALVRVSDVGNQVLAGDDIVSQVEYWWPRWQQEQEKHDDQDNPTDPTSDVVAQLKSLALDGPALQKVDPQKVDPQTLNEQTPDNQSVVSPAPSVRPPKRHAAPASTVEPAAIAQTQDPTSPPPSLSPTDPPTSPSSETDRASETTRPASAISRSIDILRLSDEIFQLKQTQEELEAQLAFKDRIIAMMAHDLRNPLTAASIAIDTLEMGYNPDRPANVPMRPKLTIQLLKNAKAQIRTIDRMITDILQTARRADGAMRIQPQPTELRPLCLMALESVEAKIKAKQQATEVDIPQDLPQIYVDAEQIRRLMTNLLDNAVKYTPTHGVIKLTALHRTTQQVQISIQDTGPGIPESKQAQIFEERFRLQRDQQEDGYGIGLALCRRIVQAHFGKLWVDSTPGEGSTFHVVLPVYRKLPSGE
ncbi:MAG: histidine kinase [Cyanobacteria bacterium J06632_22]